MKFDFEILNFRLSILNFEFWFLDFEISVQKKKKGLISLKKRK